MIEKMDISEISSRIDLPNGDSIVLLDRLGKGDRYSKEQLARNVLRIDRSNHIKWWVKSPFDAEGNPFTRLHYIDGNVTAYRWDGGSYGIDMETGSATPLILQR
jgi:hypothetical protein